jgi:hypothetical protein
MSGMTLHPTATRIWKHLTPDERLIAAKAFFSEPAPELAAAALGVIAKARHMRPQAARSLAPEAQARILGSVLDPGEPVAQGLLVSLHLADRRPLLAAFLDAAAIPHDNGILAEEKEAAPPLPADKARQAITALASFPRAQVMTYVNTLLLQDPERWGALERAEEWLAPEA